MTAAERFRRTFLWFAIASGALLFLYLSGQFDYVPRRNRPGPDLWPKLVLFLMLATCAAGALVAWFGGTERDADLAKALANRAGDEPAPEAAGAKRLPLALAGIAAMVAYVAVLPLIGFIPATFALMFAMIRIGGYRRDGVALAIAGLGALGFFFVFQRIVYVSLPLGKGPFEAVATTAMALMGVR